MNDLDRLSRDNTYYDSFRGWADEVGRGLLVTHLQEAIDGYDDDERLEDEDGMEFWTAIYEMVEERLIALGHYD